MLKFASGLMGPVLCTLLAASVACGQSTKPAVVDTPLAVSAERAFPNLDFRRPIVVTHAGDGSNRLFVAEQEGVIRVFPNDQECEE
ncbi:MAG: hypothetical protein ACK5YO_25290, partial [Planctomyces sp.]